MPPAPNPSVPIDAALASCDALTRLGERLRLSQRCFEAITPLLPGGLPAQVRPGPFDDEGWTLLVPNSAVSAKLRQLLPLLQARLAERGLQRPIRVRILTPPASN
jgi:hypothetical protein